jgi:hypothetical protein
MKSKKSLLPFLILSLCLIYIFILITGCGIVNKSTTSTGLEISTRTPALNATGIASTASISITFNHSINTAESNKSMAFGSSHTAGTWEGTLSTTWGAENKTLIISGITGWSSGAAKVVHIISNSTEAFKDYSGNKLANGSTLWKYTLSP